MIRKAKFKILRGTREELSKIQLLEGELGYAYDSNELYIGDSKEGNVRISCSCVTDVDKGDLLIRIDDMEFIVGEINEQYSNILTSLNNFQDNEVVDIYTKLEALSERLSVVEQFMVELSDGINVDCNP